MKLSLYEFISLCDWNPVGESNTITPQSSGHLIHSTPAKSAVGWLCLILWSPNLLILIQALTLRLNDSWITGNPAKQFIKK